MAAPFYPPPRPQPPPPAPLASVARASIVAPPTSGAGAAVSEAPIASATLSIPWAGPAFFCSFGPWP